MYKKKEMTESGGELNNIYEVPYIVDDTLCQLTIGKGENL